MKKHNPIKRSQELVQLSREHHFGLLLVWEIRRDLGKGVEFDKISKRIIDFYTTDLEKHFKEEEEYVFPLLGILPMLAKGEVPGESQKLIGMMNHFTENSGHMIAEHQIIGVQLYELQRVSHDAGMKKFIEDVQAHAKMEEEILFPAAILAGEYLKIKTGKK